MVVMVGSMAWYGMAFYGIGMCSCFPLSAPPLYLPCILMVTKVEGMTGVQTGQHHVFQVSVASSTNASAVGIFAINRNSNLRNERKKEIAIIQMRAIIAATGGLCMANKLE